MSLTPLSPQSTAPEGVLSGFVPPSAAPTGTAAVYYELNTAGSVVAVYYWDATGGWTQVQGSVSGSNWSEGLECGWDGAHNAAHLATAHAAVYVASVLTPRFSVAAVSASAIPFEVVNMASGSPVVLATGLFPAGAKHASAADCALVDAAIAPVGSFGFAPNPTEPAALYAVLPAGGHAAMPADGETFIMSLAQVF